MTKSIKSFWDKVDYSGGEQACWEWKLCRNTYNYGHTSFRSKQETAHRVAFQIVIGPIPDGMWVLHRCDNPPCCNPAHLFLGTHLDNIADMVGKGRHARGDKHMSRTRPDALSRGDAHYSRIAPEKLARGDRHGSRTHPESRARGKQNGSHTKPEAIRRGALNGQAKLTESDVLSIRESRAAGTKLKPMAIQFGVTESAISYICRRGWKHLKPSAAEADKRAPQ